ncbi:MAG: S41 family peptidase, partial [Cyclobacteriaceae bacterium]
NLRYNQFKMMSKGFLQNKYNDIAFLDKDIIYIDFKRLKLDEFKKNITKISKSDFLIIDGRGYPNGDATTIFPYLIKGDKFYEIFQLPKIIYPDQNGDYLLKKNGWKTDLKLQSFNGKVFYLVDNYTKSYGETIASYFEFSPNTTIVGEPSDGTNGNVEKVFLSDTYQITFTGMQVLKHDKTRFHGIGITPDVYVERTQKGIAEGRDEVLEKAIELAKAEMEMEN